MRFNLVFLFFVSFLSVLNSELYPSSCENLEDGVHKLKLLDGDYPVVSIRCSNNMMLIDYSLDPNIQYYFDTWFQYHIASAGPEKNQKDMAWYRWFLPSRGKDRTGTQFYISPHCSSCDSSKEYQLHGSMTGYFMTGILYNCFQATKFHNCDMDYNTGDCFYCGNALNSGTRLTVNADIVEDWILSGEKNNSEVTSTIMTHLGTCTSVIENANYVAGATTHDQCQEASATDGLFNLKPSIGTDGTHCMCISVETTDDEYDDSDIQSTFDATKIITEKPQDFIEKKSSISNIIELTNDDFKDGTYRIRESGYYKIMEDITFNFNEGDAAHPNDNYGWLPNPEWDDDDKYPGAGNYYDAYHLGFFAGITIEAHNVILDLNGFTLQMHKSFYVQQRWFTIVELGRQYFLPGQGVGMFGGTPYFSKHVTIKNGVLGLTSHHGIHGNFNSDILIDNVQIIDFETHGIQFNGFNDITIQNVEIGPVSNEVYVNGHYGHWRMLLPRLRKIAEEADDESIQFYGRDSSTTMTDIADEIELKLNMISNYLINNIEPTDEDELDDWESAKKMFLNPTGIAYASVFYGIFLNTNGASVFTYNSFTLDWSTNAVIKNVIIHDADHSMKEQPRFYVAYGGVIFGNAFFAPLEAEALVGYTALNDPNFNENFDNGLMPYIGNIITDAVIAMHYLSDNWDYLQIGTIMQDKLVKWALYNDNSGIGNIGIGCNNDMQMHSGKGSIGIRLDGIDGAIIENIKIYNLKDSTPLGSTVCGNYKNERVLTDNSGGHFLQILPIQYGFSGNTMSGIVLSASKNIEITNIDISDLSSETGNVYGIAIWTNVNITNLQDVTIKNLNAGTTLELGSTGLKMFDLPNLAPEACGIKLQSITVSAIGPTYYSYIENYDETSFTQCNIQGHITCAYIHEEAITPMNRYSDLGVVTDSCQNDDIDDDISIINDDNTTNVSKSNNFWIGFAIIISITLMISAFLFNYIFNDNNNKLNNKNYKYSHLQNYGSTTVSV